MSRNDRSVPILRAKNIKISLEKYLFIDVDFIRLPFGSVGVALRSLQFANLSIYFDRISKY